MLYDGAIRFMEAGKHAMQSGDIYVQNENVQKAQRIIAELMATLDMEQGGGRRQPLVPLFVRLQPACGGEHGRPA